MNPVLLVIVVFLLAAVADYLWARYTIAAAKRMAFVAANWGAAIPISTAVITVVYIDNLWYLVPYVLGCWVGTYIAVERAHL